MRWPWVSRARYEFERDAAQYLRGHVDSIGSAFQELQGKYLALKERNEADAARYDALLEKYHALRPTHSTPEPQPAIPTSPLAELGPLTRAALADMANGQSGAVVRAMRNKALALWVEQQNDPNVDRVVAQAVYAGEAVNPS